MNNRFARLCLVTNLRNQPFDLYKLFLTKAIQGGVTSIQLREKTQNLTEYRQLAWQFKIFLHPYKIPLIINDHVDIAKEVDAEGVHIGQSDTPPQLARKILGPNKFIGWSVETLTEVHKANQLDCINYVAASAVFPSKTKPDCKTIWGVSGLQQVIQLSKYPVMAIGGIKQNNINLIMNSGACGAAVIGAIHDHPDPQKAAADLITEIDKTYETKELSCLRKCSIR